MSRFDEYKVRNFRQKDLNIETTPICTLLCSQCKRTTFIDLNDRVPIGKDITPKQFEKLINYFNQITFCGQLSDPVFNKDFLKLLEMCAKVGVSTRVLTAATGRSEDWYKRAFEIHPKAKWTFGIDGPPEISHKYRVNQDGVFLFKMMVLAKSMGLKVFWQYIIFPWNEKYVEKCKRKAKKLGIQIEFIVSERE